MSDSVGEIGWIDMTVDDATATRDFYQDVVGWNVEDTSMGDYSDYTMMSPGDGEAIAGICHARGSNSDLPGGWLIYIVVADVDIPTDIAFVYQNLDDGSLQLRRGHVYVLVLGLLAVANSRQQVCYWISYVHCVYGLPA